MKKLLFLIIIFLSVPAWAEYDFSEEAEITNQQLAIAIEEVAEETDQKLGLANTTTDINPFYELSENFSFYPDRNEIEVIHRESSPWVYCNGTSPPDKVWKEIYGVVDSQIKLIKTIKGEHHQTQITDEYIEWPEE